MPQRTTLAPCRRLEIYSSQFRRVAVRRELAGAFLLLGSQLLRPCGFCMLVQAAAAQAAAGPEYKLMVRLSVPQMPPRGTLGSELPQDGRQLFYFVRPRHVLQAQRHSAGNQQAVHLVHTHVADLPHCTIC